MTELESYIHSYFGIAKPNDLSNLSAFFKPTKLLKGEYFIRTSSTANKLGFVKSGLLRMYSNVHQKEVTQWIACKGYFVTDLAGLVFGETSRWEIQALVDTELYVIDRLDYQRIGDIIPEWNKLESLFLARCFTMLEDRVFGHLSLTAEERYLQFFNQNKELFNQVPLQYIASMLGMTPETFSRIRKSLTK